MTDIQQVSRQRRRGWVVWLCLAVAVVTGVWGGVWLTIRAEVERQLDQWLTAEAVLGREHRCPQRHIGGFPFRIDVVCRDAVLQMHTPNGMMIAQFGSLTVTALIYNPDHVIADFSAPLTIRQKDELLAFIDFQGGQASLTIHNQVLERLSVVLTRPSFARADNIRPEIASQMLELHARPSPVTEASKRDYDLAISLSGLGPAGIRPHQGADLSSAAVIRAVPSTAGEDSAGVLAAWARAGGLIDLVKLRLTRGGGILGINGKLGFNERGLAQGGFEAVVADSAALLNGLAIPGFGDLSLVFGPALTLVGRSGEIEGKRGTRVDVRVDNGQLSLGAVVIRAFPPVF